MIPTWCDNPEGELRPGRNIVLTVQNTSVPWARLCIRQAELLCTTCAYKHKNHPGLPCPAWCKLAGVRPEHVSKLSAFTLWIWEIRLCCLISQQKAREQGWRLAIQWISALMHLGRWSDWWVRLWTLWFTDPGSASLCLLGQYCAVFDPECWIVCRKVPNWISSDICKCCGTSGKQHNIDRNLILAPYTWWGLCRVETVNGCESVGGFVDSFASKIASFSCRAPKTLLRTSLGF